MKYVIVCSLVLTGCYTVSPGTAILRVHVCGGEANPYTVHTSGRLWSGPCTDDYEIPLQEQRSAWESTSGEAISFSGVDGQAVSVDVGIAYQVENNDEKIVHLARTYGVGVPLEQIIDGKVRDVTRDSLNDCAATLLVTDGVSEAAASRKGLTVQDIYGAEKTALFECAERMVREEFAADGLLITRLTLNSDIRLPERIKTAMEEAQKATQEADRIKRELEGTRATEEKKIIVAEADAKERTLRAQAEADSKKISAQADADAMLIAAAAEAEANTTVARSLTPAVLEARRLEIEAARVRAWKGDVPDVVLGEGASTMIRLDVAE